MKAVQDNAAKTNPDKNYYCDSSRGSTWDDNSSSGRNFISRSLIVIISLCLIRDIGALVGHLVGTAQIAVQAGLVSVVANRVILRVSVRYCSPLAGQTRRPSH